MPKILPENAHLYDFHFHSYYSDGHATFKDIIEEIIRKRHLNGLTITDHPYRLGAAINEKIPSDKVIHHSFQFQEVVEEFKNEGKLSNDFMCFPGSCEFFTRLKEDSDLEVELIALGVPNDFIEDNGGVKRLTELCTAEELIEKIHENSGLVIIPHPFFFTSAYKLLKLKLTKITRPDAFEGINYTTGFINDNAYQNFLEQLPLCKETKSIAHNFGYFNWMATTISQLNNYGKKFDYPLARELATVGSSDAHFSTMIGAAATLVNEPIRSIEDLRRVFSKKQTQPIYNPLWCRNTDKFDVYKEIWEAYGPFVNDGIVNRSKAQWILAKTITDIVSFFFD